jgi:outer membrane protein assembly factor BamB
VPTWSTPTIHTAGGRAQLIVNGYKHIGGYDLRTGKELWRLQGGGDIPVPTPVIAHNLVFITNAHGRMAPIYAIRTSAAGDISLQGEETTNSHVAWSRPRDGGYMQTPLVYGDHLYVCRDNGVLSCYEAKTGSRLYEERLGTGRTGFTASPIAADGKLYFTSEYGDIYVVRAGPKFALLAVNPMGEICMATPAISAGTLYFRTQGHIVAIAERTRQ